MTLNDWGWTDFFARQLRGRSKPELIPARVIRGEKNYFRVWSEAGELTVRFAGKIRHQAGGREDFPVVGDWVLIEPQPQKRGFIHVLLQRRTSFSRNLPGRRKGKNAGRSEQQVIAANVDLVFIVSGLDRDFNPRRIERYLTLVGGSGADAVILLNKTDLCDNPRQRQKDIDEIACGSPVHLCLAREPASLDILTPYLVKGRTIALLGSSGVGKSTILNGLLKEERQKVAAVSDSDGKGRHTTTHRELFLLDGGAILMDNPGMRELHLWGDEEDLAESFSEIEELTLQCKFSNCRHQTEPGCAVLAAIAEGRLAAERLSSYHKLSSELKKINR